MRIFLRFSFVQFLTNKNFSRTLFELIEQEGVLLALSSIKVCGNLNPRNKHINTVVINNM